MYDFNSIMKIFIELVTFLSWFWLVFFSMLLISARCKQVGTSRNEPMYRIAAIQTLSKFLYWYCKTICYFGIFRYNIMLNKYIEVGLIQHVADIKTISFNFSVAIKVVQQSTKPFPFHCERRNWKYAVYVLRTHSFKKLRDSFSFLLFPLFLFWVDYSKLTKLLPIIQCSSSSSPNKNVFAVATFVRRSLWQTLSLWIVWIVGHIWIAFYSFGCHLPSIQLPIQCRIRNSYI